LSPLPELIPLHYSSTKGILQDATAYRIFGTMRQSSITAWLKNKPDVKPKDKEVIISDNDSPGISLQPQALPLPSFSKQPTVPPHVEFASVSKENITQFRRLIGLVLPISYGDSFYSSIVNDATISSLTLVAYWREDATSPQRMIAGISAKIIDEPEDGRIGSHDKTTATLYVATLGTLSPYRGHGVAEALIRQIQLLAANDYKATSITVHVWESNDEARLWYKRRGFEEIGYEAQYYRRLKPSGAWLLERPNGPSDFLGGKLRLDEEVRDLRPCPLKQDI
jgi:N-alpha-acetyltransferase 50